MNSQWRWLAGILLSCALGSRLWAGGSGLNVVVVVNQNSTNSVQLGNYYCEKRQVPPQNVLHTSWAGGRTAWQRSDFNSVILNPLLAMLSARQLTNQIDYVLLSMDFPYRVTDTNGANSTTSALFYGFVPDGPPPGSGVPASCSLPDASSNSYAGSEAMFRSVAPGISRTNFLAVMLTSSNLAQAELVVDRGVAADGTFPPQTAYLAKSSDTARNIRFILFDNAIFNTRLGGDYALQRTNADPPYSFGASLGLQSGSANNLLGNTSFVPGSLADNLSSYGGVLFENSGQFDILALLNAGVAGCYGTVLEPCAYMAKFPTPQAYFYQARGFSMAESYYQSITNPYQGVLLGEPLAAPFAVFPTGAWTSLPANVLLSGTTNLSLQFNAADASHPLQQVDLFLDGTFVQTLTNIPPRQNNTLTVTIRGHAMTYTVPANATLQSIATGLTALLNQSGNTSFTKVQAFDYGDRIELRSSDLTTAGAQVGVTASSATGSAPALNTFITASRASCLDTIASGIRTFDAFYNPSVGSYLQLSVTKTNGAVVKVAVTNSVSGTTISGLTQELVNLINATPALQGSDGVAAEDFLNFDNNSPPAAQFNVRARSIGWAAAQLQTTLSGSSGFAFQPAGAQRLDQNLPDLEPRDHLYISAGLTSLGLTFPFNTAGQSDGYHELTAVVYEGSHVRTQGRVSQTVRIQNTSLSATFNSLMGDTNIAQEATLQFSVVANTGSISKIELFSTGGSLTSVVNQSSVVFSVAGPSLGVGMHPFYAIVTANNGNQYRTETKWIRLVGPDSPFAVAFTAPPPTLAWPTTVGRSYDVLTTTNLAGTFQPTATLTASNSAAAWVDTNAAAGMRFYRVRTTQ